MEQQSTPARRGPKPNPDTRDNLIRVGTRMLHESGYTATGIKEIVDAAKVPKGSFYNHFESKETFAKDVVDSYFDQGLLGMRAILADPTVPPLDRLRNYFSERIRTFETMGYVRGCMLGNMSLEVADQSATIRDRLVVHFETWSALFESCIAEAQRAGTIGNPLPAPLLAQFLLNSWEGALLRMRVGKSDTPMKEFVEVVFRAILV